MKQKANKRMLEGVVLGGMCSVIALDLAEVTGFLMEPFVKKCYKYVCGSDSSFPDSTTKAADVQLSSDINQSVRLSNVQDIQTTAASPGQVNGTVDKAKEKKKVHRHIMKRVFRLILLSVAVYLVASYVTQ